MHTRTQHMHVTTFNAAYTYRRCTHNEPYIDLHAAQCPCRVSRRFRRAISCAGRRCEEFTSRIPDDFSIHGRERRQWKRHKRYIATATAALRRPSGRVRHLKIRAKIGRRLGRGRRTQMTLLAAYHVRASQRWPTRSHAGTDGRTRHGLTRVSFKSRRRRVHSRHPSETIQTWRRRHRRGTRGSSAFPRHCVPVVTIHAAFA